MLRTQDEGFQKNSAQEDICVLRGAGQQEIVEGCITRRYIICMLHQMLIGYSH